MLEAHKRIFFTVAKEENCWIIVRQPNRLSDSWIGKPGYTPKPKSCTAKTSNNANFQYGGLVVDPTINHEAFIEDLSTKFYNIIKAWYKFAPAGKLPNGYTCTKDGVVKYFGKAIHADYDIMALTKADKLGNMIFTSPVEEAKLFYKIKQLLNFDLTVDMIQHGTEFCGRFNEVGASVKENVLCFGPKIRNRPLLFPSSFPDKKRGENQH